MPVELESDPEGTEPEEPDTENGEEIRYLPSGRVRLLIGRKAYMLRRPLLGEFQDLRELFYEAQDDQRQALIARIEAEAVSKREEAVAEAADDLEGRIAAIHRSTQRAQDTRKQSAIAEQALLKWSRQAIETLSGKKLPEDDRKLPVYLSSLAFVQGVQQHWMTFPLASGAV